MKMSEFDLSSNSLLMKQNNMNSDKSKLYSKETKSFLEILFINLLSLLEEYLNLQAHVQTHNKERMLLSIKGLLSLKKENSPMFLLYAET